MKTTGPQPKNNQLKEPLLCSTAPAPKPGDFALGSVESRAAARAECERRARIEDENAVVVIWTGLPGLFREHSLVIDPPDSLSRYRMPDTSTVEVIRRHWDGQHGSGVTIYVEQTWPDGSVYHGNCLVKSLEEVQRLGARAPE
jgi:hypothetical protein